jgi:hypothetical protein
MDSPFVRSYVASVHAKCNMCIAALESENNTLRHLLEDLHAMVRGECPSLLNEDSGGDARLDIQIRKVLNKTELSA